MDWRPLSERNGQLTDIKFDSDGRAIIRSRENVDLLLDANKALREHSDRGYIGDGTFRRVASIPPTVQVQWLNEGIDIFSGDHQKALARKLNDPDNFFLRTAPGHIGVSNDVAR